MNHNIDGLRYIYLNVFDKTAPALAAFGSDQDDSNTIQIPAQHAAALFPREGIPGNNSIGRGNFWMDFGSSSDDDDGDPFA